MSSVQRAVQRIERRGLVLAEQGQERHQTPRHDHRQAWFVQMPADDRACVEAWLHTRDRQERQRRLRLRQDDTAVREAS